MYGVNIIIFPTLLDSYVEKKLLCRHSIKYMSFDRTKPNNNLPPIQSHGLKNEDFTDLLLKAQKELSELNGYTLRLPNPEILLSPSVIRESVESSSIENINTTTIDVLKNQLLPEAERTKADKEVIRYKTAIDWGASNLFEYSISTRLIKGIMCKLISSSDGEYRTKQNHIVNSSTGEIIYTPPTVNKISELVIEWEKFANNTKNDTLHPLVRIALAHYQFEAIHPFDDGNGRTGRIVMVLQLLKEDVLTLPVLYISSYIHKHRNEYYKLLQDCNENQAYKPFVEFMLKGFHLQALETKKTLLSIMSLFYVTKKRLKTEHAKIYSGDLVESLFMSPIISPSRLSKDLGIHRATASKYLQELMSTGILEIMKYRTYRFYYNSEFLNILNGRKK